MQWLVLRCNVMKACHFTQVLSWYCIINAFKTVYLILTRGEFVNLDCNLQTVEATPATGNER